MGETLKYEDIYDQYDGLSAKKYLHHFGKRNDPISTVEVHETLIEGFDMASFLEERGFTLISNNIHFYTKKDLTCLSVFYFSLERLMIISGSYDPNKNHYVIARGISYLNKQEELKSLIGELTPNIKPVVNKKHINFLGKNQNGFYVSQVEMEKEVEINFDLNYNNDFDHQKIANHISNKDNGLILLGGVPGSGKSYYIKYLINNVERPFLFISNQYIELMTSPEFVSFAVEKLKDYVLILEDCEGILQSRDLNKNSSVSTVLNLTDGIIGSVLNLTIIGTYNTKDQIDTALFRKGRLLYEYHFDKLSVEKANNLSTILEKGVVYTKPTVLTDVYNTEDNGVAEEKKAIGFKI